MPAGEDQLHRLVHRRAGREIRALERPGRGEHVLLEARRVAPGPRRPILQVDEGREAAVRDHGVVLAPLGPRLPRPHVEARRGQDGAGLVVERVAVIVDDGEMAMI
jgi:hypothetical protein